MLNCLTHFPLVPVVQGMIPLTAREIRFLCLNVFLSVICRDDTKLMCCHSDGGINKRLQPRVYKGTPAIVVIQDNWQLWKTVLICFLFV